MVQQYKVTSGDLITVDKQYCSLNGTRWIPYLNITVFELKKDKVGISAFFQAIRYCKGIKSYLENWSDRKKTLFNNPKFIEVAATRIINHLN